MIRMLTTLFLLGSLLAAARGADKQPARRGKPHPGKPRFDLQDGDRVVLLGGTLIEREQTYGYWETMLTARYPKRRIIFRNLGWSGDTVWAESRGIFDSPDVGYKRMLEHVGRLKPTVIVLGYGNNEAFAGKAGLSRFIQQYNKLIDDLTGVSAKGVRFVILSPTRQESLRPPLPDPKENNQKRKLYSGALQRLAEKRSCVFVDLMIPFGRTAPFTGPRGTRRTKFHVPLTDNGMHLNAFGYRVSGEVLREQLCPLPQRPHLALDASGRIIKGIGARPEDVESHDKGLRFEIEEDRVFVGGHRDSRGLIIKNLKPGEYHLKLGGVAMLRASAERWSEGLSTSAPKRSERLRRAIIEKNRLYFHRWRPQNVTYLFLFRKHEQGNNAKEVAEFDKLVAEKEKEIARLKIPLTRTYELVPVKEKKR